MNPALLPTITGTSKKQIGFVLATLTVILALPFMAVFSLGTGALSFLSGSDSTDVAYAISTTTQGVYEGGEISGDTYAWGNCTYWVYALRLKAGDPVPTTWGNAATWAPRALLDGYAVDGTPSAGAVMQTANSAGGLGHVAYVTAVDPITGNWTISEMNSVGLNIVDVKTYPPAAASKYNFIHSKVKNNAI
ncbi:MAG: CHAP domain-containing protein [Candidatus Saccharimonadales bacterium]